MAVSVQTMWGRRRPRLLSTPRGPAVVPPVITPAATSPSALDTYMADSLARLRRLGVGTAGFPQANVAEQMYTILVRVGPHGAPLDLVATTLGRRAAGPGPVTGLVTGLVTGPVLGPVAAATESQRRHVHFYWRGAVEWGFAELPHAAPACQLVRTATGDAWASLPPRGAAWQALLRDALRRNHVAMMALGLVQLDGTISVAVFDQCIDQWFRGVQGSSAPAALASEPAPRGAGRRRGSAFRGFLHTAGFIEYIRCVDGRRLRLAAAALPAAAPRGLRGIHPSGLAAVASPRALPALPLGQVVALQSPTAPTVLGPSAAECLAGEILRQERRAAAHCLHDRAVASLYRGLARIGARYCSTQTLDCGGARGQTAILFEVKSVQAENLEHQLRSARSQVGEHLDRFRLPAEVVTAVVLTGDWTTVGSLQAQCSAALREGRPVLWMDPDTDRLWSCDPRFGHLMAPFADLLSPHP